MSHAALRYVGGPTAILEWAGLRVLTDPTFDEPQSYPDPDGTPLVKTHGPGVAVGELGDIDLVLLSHHEHEDNLDTAGRSLLTGTVLSTPEAAADLAVTGLAPWQAFTLGAATITAVPALHGPPGCESYMGTVTGFVLEAPGEPTVYVSGDNASLDCVRAVALRFASIDIAILFAGAARVPSIDAALTLTSVDAATAAQILGAGTVVGLHTEDWEHFSESRADLEAAFAGLDLLVATPRGEWVDL
jgi:L-ascorbate metabolism protein UlaG (beta-lactamase superfamily)